MKNHLLHLIFSRFFIANRSDDGRAHFWLLIDEERYFYLENYTTYSESVTTTINVELTAGQIVRVENNISTFISGTDSA